MSIKNFKISTGLDLEGLILTAGDGELLVNGSSLATTQYVDSAIGNIDVDLSDNAGAYLDWNAGTSVFDVNVNDIADALTGSYEFATGTDITTALAGYATEGFVTSQGYLTSADLSGYVTETGTQDLSNKRVIDTLVFSDGVTIADEGEIAILSPNHEFEIKANSGHLELKTVATDADVNVSSLYGDIVLNATGGSYIGSVAAANEIATKEYVDGLANGLDVKASVRVASSSHTGYANEFLPTDPTMPQIDGIVLNFGDRVLLKNENNSLDNGIYVLLETGQLVRAADADQGNLTRGSFTFVESGTNAGKGFVVTNVNSLGVELSQFSETGNYITSVGTGLDVTGGNLTVVADTFDAFGAAGDVQDNLDTHTDATAAHGATGAVVGTTNTQTLSNKTLASPSITVPGSTAFPYEGIFNSSTEFEIVSWVGGNADNATSLTLNGTQFVYGVSYDGTYPVASVSGNKLTFAEGVIPSGLASAGSTLTPFNPGTITIGKSSTISPTEISYLDGVTFSIQTQLDGKLTSADLSGYATESYVDTAIGNIPDAFITSVGANLSVDVNGGLNLSSDVVTVDGTQTLTNKNIGDRLTFNDGGNNSSIDVDANDLYVSANNDLVLSAYIGNVVVKAQTSGSVYVGSANSGNEVATEGYVDTAINALVDGAPGVLDTLNELAAALGDDENFASTITTALGGKQATLTAGNGIAIDGSNNITVDLNDIAGAGITVNGNTIEAAPGYISSVDASFAVSVAGELSLSDEIIVTSVALTDSANNITAASDVFGNGSTSTYAMGSAVTVGTLPAGYEVADVFVTLKDSAGASRTSKLTHVNTGGDAPTWTEYGIIVSGSFPATTLSFDASGNIIANVTGSGTYSVKGVVTILK